MDIQDDSLEVGNKQTMHILMLNEYCLLEIFEYLKIEEVLRMEEVCTRFQEISHRIYLSTRKLDINDLYESHVTIPEAMKITSCVGPHIHKLSVQDCKITLKNGEIPVFTPFDDDDESISDPQVEHMVKQYEDGTFEFRSLKNVRLLSCEITDEEFSYLLPLEQLEVLNVMQTPINKDFLKSLKNITEINLNLNAMDPWDSKAFKEFSEATPNLRGLHLVFTPIVPEDLTVIATSLRKLEKISLNNDYLVSQEDFRVIADLPKLKHLVLCEFEYRRNIDNVMDDTPLIDLRQFLLLVSHHNRLETLYYAFRIENMEFSTINRALGNLTNLKKFIIGLEHGDSPDSLFLENILKNFTTKHKLEKLTILSTPKITTKPLEMLIKRCPTIRLIDLSDVPLIFDLDMNFLNNLRDCLSQRYHVLEIRLAKAQNMTYEEFINGRVIKNLRLIFE